MNNLSRMDRKKEINRQKIVDTAIDLFTRHGVDTVTMEQIAVAADVARGTLYNHFPVKEAIIAEFIERQSEELNSERIGRLRGLPDTRTRMTLALQELMEGVKARQDLFENYFTYRVSRMISLHPDESQEKGLRALERAIIRMGQESGEIREDIPQSILEALFEFVFIEVAQQFYRNPDGFNKDDIIAKCVEVFLKGVNKT